MAGQGEVVEVNGVAYEVELFKIFTFCLFYTVFQGCELECREDEVRDASVFRIGLILGKFPNRP